MPPRRRPGLPEKVAQAKQAADDDFNALSKPEQERLLNWFANYNTDKAKRRGRK